MQGTSFPGVGNISEDPLWRDPAARDYRLGPDSPCVETGAGGANMGIVYPVGGLPGTPSSLRTREMNVTNVLLRWAASSGASRYIIERSFEGAPFIQIAAIATPMTNHIDSGLPAGDYTYRVRATNIIGSSFDSTVLAITVSADSDNDGMGDSWEEQNGLTVGNNDAAGDLDGDGSSNLQEFQAGTRANDPNSVLRLHLRVESGQAVFWFQAVADKSYTIQGRSTLDGATWTNFLAIAPGIESGIFSATNDVAGAAQFFRLVTE